MAVVVSWQLATLYTEGQMQPNGVLEFAFRHAWLVFILIDCINGVIWWGRAQSKIAVDPTLEKGYRTLIRGWLIYGSLPWLVMGAGILCGAVPSTLHYLNPRNGPFVIVFYATVVVLWIASFQWLFFRGGAEALLAHPGLLNLPRNLNRPWTVKLWFLLCLAGGVAGLLMMIFLNIQVPSAL